MKSHKHISHCLCRQDELISYIIWTMHVNCCPKQSQVPAMYELGCQSTCRRQLRLACTAEPRRKGPCLLGNIRLTCGCVPNWPMRLAARLACRKLSLAEPNRSAGETPACVQPLLRPVAPEETLSFKPTSHSHLWKG